MIREHLFRLMALIILGALAAAANANAAAANANIASAGAPNVTYEMVEVYVVLPAGCVTSNVQGKAYYLCGNTWFMPLMAQTVCITKLCQRREGKCIDQIRTTFGKEPKEIADESEPWN